MKKSKFTESQIVYAIKQSETGTKVDDICRQVRDFPSYIFQLEEEIWWGWRVRAKEASPARGGKLSA